MRVLILFIICSMSFVHATSSYAQKTVINIDARNQKVETVLKEIEKQSGFGFFFNNKHVNLKRVVSVTANEGSIFNVLDELFAGTNVKYSILDKKIILSTEMDGVQQDKVKVTGKVTDALGEAVIGASIMEKGTTNGTITDMDGNFTLMVASPQAVLSVSYIGYQPQDIRSQAGKPVNIVLKEDAQALDEVVVVGYGTAKKVNVIGSIATVNSKKLENRATSSIVSALTGQMPGVTITQAGGRPGENTGTIRVRGVGSFSSDSDNKSKADALILIDGIPGNMTDINPNDIESISVLKDASTAAIYGSRAANGVVLVTTKMGKAEKVSVTYNGYVGFNRATALPEYVDSWDYARLLNEAEGITRFTDDEIQAMRDGSQPDNWANEKFVDDIFSGNGFQTGHDISLNGGNERSQYFASFGYLSQNGIVPHNNYTRYTGRVNLTSKLADNLKLTIRLRGDSKNTKEPGTAGAIDGEGMMLLIQQGLRFPGFRPSKLSDGTWGPGVKNFGTAKAWLESESFSHKPVRRFDTNVSFEYKPVKGLRLTAIGAYNFANTQEKIYRATLPVTINGANKVLGPSYLNEKNTNTEYLSFQATADYSKTFNKVHNIDVLVGYSWEQQSERDLEARRDNFPSNDYPYMTVGSPDNQTNSGGGKDWVIQSVFGRAQYNYAERYLAEVTMRYDGSSRFPADSRYAFFPSAALGWRISEENFFRENEKLGFISNLKLKASVGILGNNNIGNYAYQSVYVLGKNYNYPFGGGIQQGAQLKTHTDPRLKWETTRTVDGGIEAVLWNGLLSADISYFYRYTYDILFKPNASASSIFGLEMGEVNTGELSNRGWEFAIGHRNQVGDFSYGVNANFSIIKNKVETLGVGNVKQANGMVGNGSELFIGYPVEMYYGYQTDGVFLDQQDIDDWFAHTDQSAMGSNKAQTKPGDLRYKDISGPDGVPDGKVDATYDRVYLGSRVPKYTFGLSFNAAYKGFDLNLFLQGVAGVSGRLNDYAGYAFWGEGNVQKWQMEGAFDPENPVRNPKYPRITNMGNTVGVNSQLSDYWIRNAAYLRIKNIQVGYTLPKSILKNTFIQSVRIYAASENPFTFHGYPTGWDPEINSGGQFYPVLANYTFGVNLKF